MEGVPSDSTVPSLVVCKEVDRTIQALATDSRPLAAI